MSNKPLSGENLEAESFARWLRLNGYKFTHIANESGLPPRIAMLSAMRKKRMGLSPGFPDYIIVLKRGSLLFIELKRPGAILKNGKIGASPSKVSEEQEEWVSILQSIDNVEAHICFGAREAIELVVKIDLTGK